MYEYLKSNVSLIPMIIEHIMLLHISKLKETQTILSTIYSPKCYEP